MILKKAIARAGCVAVALSAGLFSLSASGSIANGYEMDYFSDATYTTRVGTFTFDCGNVKMMEGVKTAYSRQVMTWRC